MVLDEYGLQSPRVFSEVVRPGKQIDPQVNPANFPFGTGVAGTSPRFHFRSEDLWLQGINFGVTFQY